MWLLLIFKNMLNFIKTKPLLFGFIVISQVICIVAVFSVSGMIDSLTPQPTDDRSDLQKAFILTLGTDELHDSAYEEGSPMFARVFDEKTGDLLYSGLNNTEEFRKITENENVSIISEYGTTDYSSYPKYKDIKKKLDNVIKVAGNGLSNGWINGYADDKCMVVYSAFFDTNENINNLFPNLTGQEKYINLITSSKYKVPFYECKDGDKVKIGNTQYVVSKVKKRDPSEDEGRTALNLLLSSVDDDFVVYSITIQLTDDVTNEQILKISDTIKKEFSDIPIGMKEPEPQPLLEKQFNNMIYVVSIIIIGVILLNISRLYTYMLSKRKNTLMVFGLCGASKIRMFAIYFIEVVLTFAVSCIIGYLLFNYCLLNVISVLYPNFEFFFNTKVYMSVFGAYMGFGLLIMGLNIIPMVRKTVVEMKRS